MQQSESGIETIKREKSRADSEQGRRRDSAWHTMQPTNHQTIDQPTTVTDDAECRERDTCENNCTAGTSRVQTTSSRP
jgi:hypothetical protein